MTSRLLMLWAVERTLIGSGHEGGVLAGALDAVRSVHDRPGFVSSVLTREARGSALAKLRRFGLDQYLRTDCAAFGDDGGDHAALVEVAWRRAAAAEGLVFGPQNTVIVGDSLGDVEAGRARGVFVVGVATGDSTEAHLRDAGANAVLPDLTAFPRVRALIERGQAA